MNYAPTETIIKDFVRLTNYYQQKSKCEDMSNMLILFLLEMIEAKKCVSQNYVAVCLRHKYIELSKRNVIVKSNENSSLECWYGSNDECFENVFQRDALKKLTNKQNLILKLKFFYGFNGVEISKMLNVSRQAVYKTEKRAMKELKRTLC